MLKYYYLMKITFYAKNCLILSIILKFFFRHKNAISFRHLISEAKKIMITTPIDIDPCKLLNKYEPLLKGTYPVFNKRPKYINDYQILEKNKILNEEIKYLNQR
jgi:hypothetical protein